MGEQLREDEIDLLELGRALLKRAWAIVICLMIGAVVMGGYTKLLVTPQYQVSSMIYILGKTTSLSSTVDLQLSRQLTLDFEILAKSRPVVEEVIDTLGLDYTYEQLSGMIAVENPESSNILKMVVTNPDPELAANIANEMADATASRIAEVMVTDKPSTVEDAVIPVHPVSPSLKKNVMIGGLAGAVLAAGVIAILFLMDDTIKSEEDVRKYMNLNVLASMPKEKKKRKKIQD